MQISVILQRTRYAEYKYTYSHTELNTQKHNPRKQSIFKFSICAKKEREK